MYLVAKAIVVQDMRDLKSLGQKRPCGFKRAVYDRDIVEDNWAKSKNGENPNIEITRYITKGCLVL